MSHKLVNHVTMFGSCESILVWMPHAECQLCNHVEACER